MLSAVALVAMCRQLLRRELAACVLTTMCALGVKLAASHAGFGLFKWAMIVQPFVVLVLAIEPIA
jgi:hypothetical protein